MHHTAAPVPQCNTALLMFRGGWITEVLQCKQVFRLFMQRKTVQHLHVNSLSHYKKLDERPPQPVKSVLVVDEFKGFGQDSEVGLGKRS